MSDGADVWVQLTRAEAERLSLTRDSEVHLRPPVGAPLPAVEPV